MSFEENEEMPEPAEVSQTPEEYLANQKKTMRNRAWWAFGTGAFVILVHFGWAAILGLGLSNIVTIFFVLGVFFFFAGVWGLWEARRLSMDDIIPSAEAIEFSRTLVPVVPYYSQLMIGGFIFVIIAQVFGGLEENSILYAAALLKPQTLEKGEYWRLLTSAVMHGGFLHIFFNSYATFQIGKLIEMLSDRAHLAIVFVLSAIGGSLLSCLLLMNEEPSVGASGGIMGMIGFIAVYGYKRKRQLPSDFLRTMLMNIGLIAMVGIVGYQMIDNAGHLGGLMTGAAYGAVAIPSDYRQDPRNIHLVTKIAGLAAMGVFAATCVLAILLLLGKVTL
jgi:membrane associated rhomboid family serine protease